MSGAGFDAASDVTFDVVLDAAFDELFATVERAVLATLPTPIERGPELPGGARLWVKRDDLTGLGAGGNKARKLEFLCAEALRAGARSLVTVGAAPPHHWGELEIAREQLTRELAEGGAAPYAVPIGGSTATGALGYVVAFVELV